ncbi:MAG TPA: hypothetical protein VNO25_09305, partial [Streptosporangiaceae bacterium]|nr:hypothetical protein [Streptosporangiaceae bacterium]
MITSRQPLDDAPWDAGTALYVRKAPHVVVAGLAGDSALVDQTLPIAETAAAYDVGLVDHVGSRDLNQQQGFIVFVSGDAAVRDRWLAAQAQPSGWPPRFLGARVFQLPGPGASPDDANGAGSVSDGSTGGARMVVGPYARDGDGGTPHSQMVTLVRDFMLDILASHDENRLSGLPAAAVPSWPVEGLAVAVQILFEASTNPTPAAVRQRAEVRRPRQRRLLHRIGGQGGLARVAYARLNPGRDQGVPASQPSIPV